MSLAEILVAAGLMLVLSTVVLGTLVPLMQRSVKVDDRQERQQRLIVVREALVRQLQRGWVTRVEPDFVEFYLPETVGDMSLVRITPDGVPAWVTTEPHRFALDQETLVETWPNGRRPLWNLGPGASLRFDATNLPLVMVELAGRQGGAWQQSLGVVLQHYNQP